ncbi:MAG: prepilin-type N-terminal cleavage/methylation domain-containing protein [Fimbriimonadaceae bacterium]
MKRAFTLIELLVVIAIIAILAAILFPVFAQARSAALQTVAINGQKQIGTSLQLYINDYDAVLPRNDDCKPNSSLNADLNSRPFNPTGAGCSSAPWQYRMNHYSWQKWVLPYVKSVDLFFHPMRGKLDRPSPGEPFNANEPQWSGNGQIMGSYALNLGLTGSINTYNRAETANGRFRNSWLGGTIAAVPSPSRAMLFLEYTNPVINYAPTWRIGASSPIETHGPMAVREFWQANFMKPQDIASCTFTNDPDAARTTNGNIIVGMVDTSVRAIPAARFLSLTPPAAEIGAVLTPRTRCGANSGVYSDAPAGPNFAAVRNNADYAFWALD